MAWRVKEEPSMASNPEQDFVLKTIKSRDVHFVRFWFTDVLGSMKSFAVIPSELEDAFADGMGFDGSCIEGFCRTEESDMLAFPDASTFQVLPWRPESNAVARMFCDIRTPDGKPFEGDPRHVLARVVGKAQDMGYVFNVGPEVAFYYFKDAEGTELLDRGGYFDLTSLDYASDLRRDTVLTLEKMGIPVEYSHHENGPSQHEIDLRFTDALSMADAVMTYKLVVKEIAMKHGVYASFMPKPLSDAPGSGMHVHMSLFDFDGSNVFFDPDDPQGYHLSPLSPTPASTLTSACSPAARRPSTCRGPAPTAPRSCACPVIAPIARWRAVWSCAAPTPAPTLTLPSRSCWLRAWPASKRGLSPRSPSRIATCSPNRARSCSARGSVRFLKALARPLSCSGARSSCVRPWATTFAIIWWKQSKRSGTSTSPTYPPGSLIATWRFCRGARDAM